MKKKILIIGCGNIGLRHLHALKKINSNIIIFLYDKNIKKIISFKEKNIFILKNLNQNLTFDVVIISTSSKERFKIFKKLVDKNKVKKIIFEKFIYFRNYQFSQTLHILRQKKIKAWVNCLRREIDIFKKIQLQIKNQFEMSYCSNNWGLACNSIHFLDLFAFLIKTKKIENYSNNLNKALYTSKRRGYDELKGKLQFNVGKSSLTLEDNIKFKNKLFFIKTNNKVYSLNKFENILTIRNLKNNSLKKYKCEEPYVSNISYKIIQKLINGKKIKLTSFEETINHHKLLIKIFNKHSRLINQKKIFMIT